MKKYFVGFIAIGIAIASFAFTNAKLGDGPDCATSNYWFHVKNGLDRICTTVAIADFDPVLDPTQNGTVSTSDLSALAQGASTSLPYGCPDIPTKACALSFTQAQIQSVLHADGKYYLEPINVSQFRCCVKRVNP